MFNLAQARKLLPSRPKDSHKGDYGHVVVVAGSRDMAGAAILAGMGALRSGAGLVTLAVPEAIRRTVAAALPEALTTAAPPEPSQYDALALGPGMTTRPAVRRAVSALLRACAAAPAVVDADALNCLALAPHPERALRGRVITPHPGELARLLKRTAKAVQADRVGAAGAAARRFGCVCLLKGYRTVVAGPRPGPRTPGPVSINPTGNPGMAKGGMGDVLTGLIGGFLAQGLAPFDAARLGAFVHGLAGDLAARRTGPAALLAREVAAALPEALKRLQ